VRPTAAEHRGHDLDLAEPLRLACERVSVEHDEVGVATRHEGASDALVVRALRFHLDKAEELGWLRGLADPHLAKALVLMHDQLERPWTVASLARVAGLSRAAFAARFSAAVGEAPMAYLLRRRMRRAMTLLRGEQATLARVAESVGYGSEAALSAAFKRHTGSAPGAYRRTQLQKT